MTMFSKLTVTAAALLLTTSAVLAGAGGGDTTKLPGTGGNQMRQIKAVACTVSGSPSEFPDDINIINNGTVLPAGTKISWSVPFAGKHGTFTLKATLAGGAQVFVDGVLPGGVEAGKDCVAHLL